MCQYALYILGYIYIYPPPLPRKGESGIGNTLAYIYIYIYIYTYIYIYIYILYTKYLQILTVSPKTDTFQKRMSSKISIDNDIDINIHMDINIIINRNAGHKSVHLVAHSPNSSNELRHVFLKSDGFCQK